MLDVRDEAGVAERSCEEGGLLDEVFSTGKFVGIEGVKGQVRERLRGAAGAAEFTENIQRPGVERHADLQLAGFAPLRGPPRPLRLQRADERTVRRVEGHAEGITDRFENKPTHRLKRLA